MIQFIPEKKLVFTFQTKMFTNNVKVNLLKNETLSKAKVKMKFMWT